MRLSQALAEVKIVEKIQFQDMEISGITSDSRTVGPGDLFVCVPGMKVDGHDYAQSAMAKGAAALIVERPLPLKLCQLVVGSSRRALSQASAAYYGHPSRNMLMIGVTGTNGKTTTTYLIERVLQRKGLKVGVIGTIGNRLGGMQWQATHTTPESNQLQKLLAEMVEAGAQAVVMEVSSHALDLGRVADVEYDLAVFTNLTQDHLDYHGTLDNYLQAKGKLFSSLGQGVKLRKKAAIINGDDPACLILSNLSKADLIIYGKGEAATVRATQVKVGVNETFCQVSYQGKSQLLRLKLSGEFNVYNALAAFGVGVAEGMELNEIAAALHEVDGVDGRFEMVRGEHPFSVIVDYAHTPDGLENVLLTARKMTKGRLITVFGCGGDRDRTKRPLMGEVSAILSDVSIVTSDNPRTENPQDIINDILPGLKLGKAKELYVELDRRTAIGRALKMADSGDLVLIAGKGHETYQIIGDKEFAFDDRAIAREWLEEMGFGKG